MYYYKVLDLNNRDYDDYDDYSDYSLTKVESKYYLKKDDYLVYVDFNAQPHIGQVKGFISELDAITSESSFCECLQVVNLKEYQEKKKAEIQKARLLKAMKTQSDSDKFIEDMRKKANGSPEMQKLFAEYEKLVNGKVELETDTPNKTDEIDEQQMTLA